MQNIPTSKKPAARRTVTFQDLATSAESIFREVRETGEPIDVTNGNGIVGRIEPPSQNMEEWLRGMKALSEEISRQWPKGVSAQDAIDDIRGPW
jgi:antitoxin (DNA-binding transcriptional repressor) of toxin-antitoxin stability system